MRALALAFVVLAGCAAPAPASVEVSVSLDGERGGYVGASLGERSAMLYVAQGAWEGEQEVSVRIVELGWGYLVELGPAALEMHSIGALQLSSCPGARVFRGWSDVEIGNALRTADGDLVVEVWRLDEALTVQCEGEP